MTRPLLAFLALALLLVVGGVLVFIGFGRTGSALVLEYDASGLDRIDRPALVRIWQQRLEEAAFPWLDVELSDDERAVHVRVATEAGGDAEVSRLRALLERSGKFVILLPADVAPDFDLEAELAAWRAAHPGAALREFRVPGLDLGGAFAREDGTHALLTPHTDPAWRFTRNDLHEVHTAVGALGQPAVGFTFSPARAGAFEAFTRAHVGGKFAIVLDDAIVSMPLLNDALPGAGTIGGQGFTSESAIDLAAILRAGTLPGEPGDLRFVRSQTID